VKVNELVGNSSSAQGNRVVSNFKQRFASPETKSLIGSMHGSLLGGGANVMPDQV
jgi:hypothetical protein